MVKNDIQLYVDHLKLIVCCCLCRSRSVQASVNLNSRFWRTILWKLSRHLISKQMLFLNCRSICTHRY